MLPSRRVDHQAGAAEDGEVLAHVRDLAPDVRRQLAHGALAPASDSSTHSRFGSASARPIAANRCRSASVES